MNQILESASSQKEQGKSMENSWEYDGKNQGIWWTYHGNIMGIWWTYHGNMMDYHGNIMGIWWIYIYRIFADNWEHSRIGWRHQKSLESSQERMCVSWELLLSQTIPPYPSGPKPIALAGPGKPKWKVDHDLTAMSLEEFHCCNNIHVCPEEKQLPSVSREKSLVWLFSGWWTILKRALGISGIWM